MWFRYHSSECLFMSAFTAGHTTCGSDLMYLLLLLRFLLPVATSTSPHPEDRATQSSFPRHSRSTVPSRWKSACSVFSERSFMWKLYTVKSYKLLEEWLRFVRNERMLYFFIVERKLILIWNSWRDI